MCSMLFVLVHMRTLFVAFNISLLFSAPCICFPLRFGLSSPFDFSHVTCTYPSLPSLFLSSPPLHSATLPPLARGYSTQGPRWTPCTKC